MRRRWVWMAGGASSALMVAVGVAINQVLNSRVWSWPWFAAALVFAAATVVVDRWVKAAEEPRAILGPGLTDAKGRPLLISQATPVQLGVHPSQFGGSGDSPYIARDADDTLAGAMQSGDRRLVIVQGPRLAGATRLLAHAAQSHLAGHLALAFVADPRLTLPQVLAEARRVARGRDAVLWLDGVTPIQLGHLELGLLEDLPAGLWVLATVHGNYFGKFQVPETLRAQLEQKAVVVTLGVISERERDALLAAPAYGPLGPALAADADLLMGRLMVALEQIQDALAVGRTEESAGQIALLQAVTDWYRAEVPTLLTRRVLERDLYPAYRSAARGHAGHQPVSATGFERALAWATVKSSSKQPQLVDVERVGQHRRYVPHPLLPVVADDAGQPGSWPVAPALWEYANQSLAEDARRDVGYAALERGAYAFARRLLDHDDTKIAPAALYEVADWLNDQGSIAGARRWYERVVSTDDPDLAPVAMVDLGLLEADQGRFDEARHWLRRVVDGGYGAESQRAMAVLGAIERQRGNVAGARDWWERAVADGDGPYAPQVMTDLGMLAREEGDLNAARGWWEQAAATEHEHYAPYAMNALGELGVGLGDRAAARRWWEQAAASEDNDEAPQAMINLGVLAREEGDLNAARGWWEQAAATEHEHYAPYAMNALGELAVGRGDRAAARRWWEQAAASEDSDQAPMAMVHLGGLARLENDRLSARRWFQQAAASGHHDQAPMAMIGLGMLEKAERRLDLARSWYKRVIALGHVDQSPLAMVMLGILENDEGHPDEARRLLEQVLAVGRPGSAPLATFSLAGLEGSHGNIDQARHWYGMLINSGGPLMYPAKQSLAALERGDSDSRRADHFAKYGWQAYIDDSVLKTLAAHPADRQPPTDEGGSSPQSSSPGGAA